MPWVTFTGDFNFRPPESRSVFVAYKKGMTQFVRVVCASAAIKAGKAVQAKRLDSTDERGDLKDVEARVVEGERAAGKPEKKKRKRR